MPGDYSKTIKEALDYGLDAVESNEEIATALGYANHSPVTKRLQRLRPKFDTFMERMNGN